MTKLKRLSREIDLHHSVEISGIFYHILCEIYFGESRSAKNAVFAIFGALKCMNLVNFSLQKA